MFGFKKRQKERLHAKSQSAFAVAVRENIIGYDALIDGPFGPRRMFYADYVASGRSYAPIEDQIRKFVLPLYANTHSEVSMSGRQSSAFREQARAIIAKSVGASENDAVLFCGAGCTGAIDKFIRMLRLKLPAGMSVYGVDTHIEPRNRPVVFIGPYEHHSNDVQWRETIADVVMIEETDDGLLDLNDLEKQLVRYKDRPLKIGSFSAASNVTGIVCDTAPVAKLLHKHGALAAFDYAAAAPYVQIDMNRKDGAHMDAVFISPHKFVGGPGTPGLLIIKKKWAKNKTPVVPGGGTVSYVSPCAQAYLECIEHREEGGTPEIVGAIRAGLCFLLKEKVGAKKIIDKELSVAKAALARWNNHENIQILGSHTVDRLPIFSFLIRRSEQYLHYNFVVAVLNDVFGIQARGGCSCAGPYGHRLLDINLQVSQEYEKVISTGIEILKPGWVRVGFNYFYNNEDKELLQRAVEWVADHGYKLLPLYDFDNKSGQWAHKNAQAETLMNLSKLAKVQLGLAPNSLAELLQRADEIAQKADANKEQKECDLIASVPDHLRWFALQ